MSLSRSLVAAVGAVLFISPLRAEPLSVRWAADTRPIRPSDAALKAVDAMANRQNLIRAEPQGDTTAIGCDERTSVVVVASPDGDGARILVVAIGPDATEAERLRDAVRVHVLDGKPTPKPSTTSQPRDIRRKSVAPVVHVGVATLNRPKADFERIARASMGREGLTVSPEDGSPLIGTGPDGVGVAFYDPLDGNQGRLTVIGAAEQGALAEHLRNAVRGDVVNGVRGPTTFGYGHLAPARGAAVRRPVLVIELRDPARPAPPHDPAYYDQFLFGLDASWGRSINGYYSAVSDGRFTWAKAAILGPYPVTGLEKLSAASETEARQLAIQMAAERGKFNFAAYDTNHDGTVDATELCIVVLDNLGGTAGAFWRMPPMKLGNPAVTVAVPVIHVHPQTSFATWCHEMMHSIGAVDVYGPLDSSEFKLNTRLTLMGPTIFPGNDDKQTFYLDPWHRMQFGWVPPRVHDLRGAGAVTLEAQQTAGRATVLAKQPLLLYDPWRGPDEFFLVEFRSKTHRGGGYDADVASTGVVIWQVQQDAKKGLAQVPSAHDRGVKVSALLSRGAPGWEEGGTRAWTDASGPVTLRWIDGTNVGTRLRVGKVADDGGSVTVSWSR
jgi:M6 family metalloprotease-like protein